MHCAAGYLVHRSCEYPHLVQILSKLRLDIASNQKREARNFPSLKNYLCKVLTRQPMSFRNFLIFPKLFCFVLIFVSFFLLSVQENNKGFAQRQFHTLYTFRESERGRRRVRGDAQSTPKLACDRP